MSYPKTVAQFRKQAETGFARANDAHDVVFFWTFGPKRVEFPTGLKGFSGVAIASAPGFKSRKVVASATQETGVMVR